MYKYETHLHTYPVSACAKYGVRENLEFYKTMGYDGVFITNHFLDGNINADKNRPYNELIDFYFSDYEDGIKIGKELGIKVFLGIEMSYKGTDFLIYGLEKAWFSAHPEIMDMQKSKQLSFLALHGALVIQAHPYREAAYIDHIRLFPKKVHGVEVINACRTKHENHMAKIYAEEYGLLEIAGSDNHIGCDAPLLAGIKTKTPITDEKDFIERVFEKQVKIFQMSTDK